MSVVVTSRIEIDHDPDLSWLSQTDAEMGEGFEDAASERLDAYNRGLWEMVGVVVSASIEIEGRRHVIEEASLWGIESDSDPDYFETVARDLASEIVTYDLEARP